MQTADAGQRRRSRTVMAARDRLPPSRRDDCRRATPDEQHGHAAQSGHRLLEAVPAFADTATSRPVRLEPLATNRRQPADGSANAPSSPSQVRTSARAAALESGLAKGCSA